MKVNVMNYCSFIVVERETRHDSRQSIKNFDDDNRADNTSCILIESVNVNDSNAIAPGMEWGYRCA